MSEMAEVLIGGGVGVAIILAVYGVVFIRMVVRDRRDRREFMASYDAMIEAINNRVRWR